MDHHSSTIHSICIGVRSQSSVAGFPRSSTPFSAAWTLAAEHRHRSRVLGDRSRIVAIEAGRSDGWYKYVNHDALVIGVDRFGASAPFERIAEELGFTPEKVAARIREWRV